MRLKKSLPILTLSTLIVLSMAGCNSNNKSSSSKESETTTEESSSAESSILISDSYKKAKEGFYKITNIELPNIEDIEVKDYPYQEGDTDYTIEIIGGLNLKYQTYLTFEKFFKEVLGNPSKANPSTGENNNRSAEWHIIDQWYQTSWDASNKHIFIETERRIHDPIFTESYKKARNQFYQVSNIELPIVYDVYANETPINNYQIGQTSYQIILDSGSNLNYETYIDFEDYFKDAFGNIDAGYPIENDNQRTSKWTVNDREYFTKYTSDGYIIIETNLLLPSMTESYKDGRYLFYQITGILLPELYNVELLPSSSFDEVKQTAKFDIPGDNDLFMAFVSYLKSIITESPINDEDTKITWDYLYYKDGRNHRFDLKMTLDNSIISIDASVLDYYTVQLTTNDDRGTVIIKNNYENSIITTYGEILTLFAKPYLEYVFDGWYINNSLISVDNQITYEVIKEDVIIEGRFLIDATEMSDSFRKARQEFYEVSDIALPALEGLEVEETTYEQGDLSYSIEITSGVNLNYQTFEEFLSFFDNELPSWNKEEPVLSGNNKRVIYTSSYSDQITLEWDDMNGRVYVYASMSGYYGVDSYYHGKAILSELFSIALPEFENVLITNNSFKRDGKEVEFGFKSDDFSDETFNEIKSAISYSFGDPIEETTSSASWVNDEKEIDLSFNESEKTILIKIANVTI